MADLLAQRAAAAPADAPAEDEPLADDAPADEALEVEARETVENGSVDAGGDAERPEPRAAANGVPARIDSAAGAEDDPFASLLSVLDAREEATGQPVSRDEIRAMLDDAVKGRAPGSRDAAAAPAEDDVFSGLDEGSAELLRRVDRLVERRVAPLANAATQSTAEAAKARQEARMREICAASPAAKHIGIDKLVKRANRALHEKHGEAIQAEAARRGIDVWQAARLVPVNEHLMRSAVTEVTVEVAEVVKLVAADQGKRPRAAKPPPTAGSGGAPSGTFQRQETRRQPADGQRRQPRSLDEAGADFMRDFQRAATVARNGTA